MNQLLIIYRNGIGAILTSVSCSILTCATSQTLLLWTKHLKLSAHAQTAITVLFFVVGYWAIYLVSRGLFDRLLTYFKREFAAASNEVGSITPRARLFAKVFFVTASELFWVVSLSWANFYLLKRGVSATRAAALAQWGVNLFIWLPLLPLWEHVATRALPRRLNHYFNGCIN